MKKVILDNGVKVIYENIPGSITSFTIGLEAGANVEADEELGLAHVVEHMIFKGTKTKNEKEINNICDEVFGFHNAMTNYPYVVYYGTCLNEDFKAAFEIYSDIILNPLFGEEGFKEEINVICEELREWSEDLLQYCEDLLFLNSFRNRRIKDLIIGKEAMLRRFTIEQVKNFYKKHYVPKNTVISIVTSLGFEEVIGEVEKYFGSWKVKSEEILEVQQVEKGPNGASDLCGTRKHRVVVEEKEEKEHKPLYEYPLEEIFIEKVANINGAKIQYIFSIHDLSQREVALLRVFNEVFGEGTSCLLYDELRTNKGLVYDVSGRIKNEKGIKLYTITLGTSVENLDLIKNLIHEKIQKAKVDISLFPNEKIKKSIKSQKLKRTLNLEKSIVLSMNLTVYEVMYKNCELLLEEFNEVESATAEEILEVVNKVFKNPAIQILMP